MAHHGAGEPYTPGEPGEEEIHLPSPTLAPPTVGLGVMLLTFGVAGLSDHAPDALRAGTPVLLIGGGLLMLLGIAVWLINDAREFAHGEHGSGHGGH